MSKSDYELEEGHQGKIRSRPCHSMWSMLLQNVVLSLPPSRDNRVMSYIMLPDMFLKTIGLFSLIIILVNSLFLASTTLFFRSLTASLAGAQHYICSETNSITHLHAIIEMSTANKMIHGMIHSNSISS